MATYTLPDPFKLGQQQAEYSSEALSAYPGLSTIQEQLSGKLPADVLANLYQTGAESGFKTGASGSDASNAATMRALGLTSVGMQQQGLTNLNAAYGTFSKLDPLGISQQKLDLEKQQRDEDFKTRLQQIGIDAERTNLLSTLSNQLVLKGMDIQSAEYRAELQAALTREGYSADAASRLAAAALAANAESARNTAYQQWVARQNQGTPGTPAGGGTTGGGRVLPTPGGASTPTTWSPSMGIPGVNSQEEYANYLGNFGSNYIDYGDYGTQFYWDNYFDSFGADANQNDDPFNFFGDNGGDWFNDFWDYGNNVSPEPSPAVDDFNFFDDYGGDWFADFWDL
jgi:hypothetical protein